MNYLTPVNVIFIIPQGLEKQCKINDSSENEDHDYLNRIIITGALDENH